MSAQVVRLALRQPAADEPLAQDIRHDGMARHERASRLAKRAARRVEWCGRGDSNPHGIATASPSSWCVCQFRHFRVEGRRAEDPPLRSLYRPVRKRRPYFFAGVSAGGAGAGAGVVAAGGAGFGGSVAGGGAAGARAGARPPITDPGPRWPTIPRTSAPTTNSTAQTVVARESTVAPLRAPNAA